MRDELENTKGILERISDQIHYYMVDHLPSGFVLIGQIAAKLLFLLAIIAVITLLFQSFVKLFHGLFKRKLSTMPFVQALYDTKVLSAFALFSAVAISQNFVRPIMDRHPSSHTFLQRLFSILMIIVAYTLYQRILKTLQRYYFLKKDYYRITMINAVTSSIQIVGYIVFAYIGLTTLFGVSSSTILGTLGALTAVILLVFRDTILGFVTGIHVSTSKLVKVGDWIGIPKYNIEGTIEDISLLTTKIQNFDKTISTIPTYDLVSTEVKNLQKMAEGSSRRIKKSIVFNVNSFKFIDEELFNELKKVNLIAEYLDKKSTEITEERSNLKNSDLIINGRQLTNIGVFRKYALNYLKQDKYIDQNEVILVRQLDITSQGMPLELYCFANRVAIEDFEDIQADIFDHLLSAAKIFDLEIMQVNKI